MLYNIRSIWSVFVKFKEVYKTMKADIGVSYLRLSDEDINKGESESIINQREFLTKFVEKQNN